MGVPKLPQPEPVKPGLPNPPPPTQSAAVAQRQDLARQLVGLSHVYYEVRRTRGNVSTAICSNAARGGLLDSLVCMLTCSHAWGQTYMCLLMTLT